MSPRPDQADERIRRFRREGGIVDIERPLDDPHVPRRRFAKRGNKRGVGFGVGERLTGGGVAVVASGRNEEHRIIADFEINDLEIGMWRSVSASVYPKFGGMFPWEIVAQAEGRHHG